MSSSVPPYSASTAAGPEALLGIAQACFLAFGLPWNPRKDNALLMRVQRLSGGDGEIAAALFKHALTKDKSLVSLPEIKLKTLRKALKSDPLDAELLGLLCLAVAGLTVTELRAVGVDPSELDESLKRLGKSGLITIRDGRIKLASPLLHQKGIFWLEQHRLAALLEKLVKGGTLSPLSAGGLLASPLLPDREATENVLRDRVVRWLGNADQDACNLAPRLLLCADCDEGLLATLLTALPSIPFCPDSARACLQFIDRLAEDEAKRKSLPKLIPQLLPALLAADELGRFVEWWQRYEGLLDDAARRRLFHDYALERLLRVDPAPVAAFLERIGGRAWLAESKDAISHLVLDFLELDLPLDRRELLKLLIAAMPALKGLPSGQQATLLKACLRAMQLEAQDAGHLQLASMLPQHFADDVVLDACLAMLADPSHQSTGHLGDRLKAALGNGTITSFLVELVYYLQACVVSTRACPVGDLLRELLVVLDARPLDQLTAWFRVEVALLLFAVGEWEQGAHWLEVPAFQHKALQAIEKELLIARFMLLEARSTESVSMHGEQRKLLLEHNWIHGRNGRCPCLRLLEALVEFRSCGRLPRQDELKEILDGIHRLPVCLRALFLAFLLELVEAGDDSWANLKTAARQLLLEDPLAGPMVLVCHAARKARALEDRIGVRHLVLDAVIIALEHGYPGWIRQMHRQFPRLRLEGLISGRSRDGLPGHKRARLEEALKSIGAEGLSVNHFGLDLRGPGVDRLLHQLAGGGATDDRPVLVQSGHDLELSLVGRLKIVARGETITGKRLGRGILRELVCFLLVERWRHPGRAWQAEDLVARIWHETCDPGKVLNSFYVYMSNAKRLFTELGLPDAIERASGGYLISPNLSLVVDLDALDGYSKNNFTDESQVDFTERRNEAIQWVVDHSQALDPSLRAKWLDELRAWHEHHFIRLVRQLRDALGQEGDPEPLRRVEATFYWL